MRSDRHVILSLTAVLAERQADTIILANRRYTFIFQE